MTELTPVEDALQAALGFARDKLLVAQMKIAAGDAYEAAKEIRAAAETLQAALEATQEDIAA